MIHRDGLPRFSARSVRCGDAGHRKACATPSETLGETQAAEGPGVEDRGQHDPQHAGARQVVVYFFSSSS